MVRRSGKASGSANPVTTSRQIFVIVVFIQFLATVRLSYSLPESGAVRLWCVVLTPPPLPSPLFATAMVHGHHSAFALIERCCPAQDHLGQTAGDEGSGT
jgi:hypothetical protein